MWITSSKMKKTYTLLLILSLIFLKLGAQIHEPVKFETELKPLSIGEAEIIFTATIDTGWHVYSTDLAGGGPISATLTLDKIEGAELLGKLAPRGNEIARFDKVFKMNVRYFEKSGQFVQKIRITQATYDIEGYLEYGVCNDESCLPPMQFPIHCSGKRIPAETGKNDSIESIPIEKTAEASVIQQTIADEYWTPVIDELKAFGETVSQKDRTWIYILFAGFAGGLLALFTPCVWPVIPMTVSFFLKRSDNKKKGTRDAFIYGISIIVIYVALGLAVTLIFGANALNSLSTNAIFNIIFFLMLIAFA
ncbi:Thiol:disulfide interchange protein DsbD, partial [termite gut metagenome]